MQGICSILFLEGKKLIRRQGKAAEREGKCAWESQQLATNHPLNPDRTSVLE